MTLITLRRGSAALVRTLQALAADRKGAAMVEYALLAGLIAVVSIEALSTLGTSVASQFNAIATSL